MLDIDSSTILQIFSLFLCATFLTSVAFLIHHLYIKHELETCKLDQEKFKDALIKLATTRQQIGTDKVSTQKLETEISLLKQQAASQGEPTTMDF